MAKTEGYNTDCGGIKDTGKKFDFSKKAKRTAQPTKKKNGQK